MKARWLQKRKPYMTIMAKDGKRAASKKLKMDLMGERPEMKQAFKACSEEAVHLLAGGRSRIRTAGQRVEAAEEQIFDHIDDGMRFYSLRKYKETFGVDARRAKMKIKKRKIGGKTIEGVYVRNEDEGIYKVVKTSRSRVTRSLT